MLTQLELHNFKQHEHAIFTFTSGLNTITGPNYSGKTTLLEAVVFALWGPSAVPGGADVVTRRGSNRMSVQLHFDVDGDQYCVRRTGSTATLVKNGEDVAKSATGVSTALVDVLGVSKRRFLQLKYGQQDETKALLTMGAAELHKIIEELSGVEIVNKVLGRASTRATKLKAAAEVLQHHDLKGMEAELQHVGEEIKTAGDALLSREGDADKATSFLQKARADLYAATEHNAALRKRKEEAANDRAALEAAEQRLYAAELENQNLPDYLNTLISDLRKQQTKHRALADLAGNRATELKSLLGQAQATGVRLSALAGEIDECETKLAAAPAVKDPNGMAKKLTALQDEGAALRQTLKTLEDAQHNAVCPTCHRPYDEAPDPVKTAADIKDTKARLQGVTAEANALSRQVEAATRQAQELAAAEGMLTGKRDELSRLEAELKELDARVETVAQGKDVAQLNEEKADHTAKAADISKQLREKEALQHTYESNLKVIDASKVKIKQIKAKLAKTDTDEPLINEQPLYDEVNKAQDGVIKANDAVQEAQARVTVLKSNHRNLEANLTRCREENEKYNKVHTDLKVVNQLQKYLRGNRDRFVAGVWAGLMQFASGFVSAATGGSIQRMSRSEDGEFTYVEDEFDMPIAAASGAQKSIMGLAVQAALSQLLPSVFNTLMLDEPTADMDATHALAVTTLLSQHGSQCLMVSHREMDASLASNAINL